MENLRLCDYRNRRRLTGEGCIMDESLCKDGNRCHHSFFSYMDDSEPFRKRYVCLKCKRCYKDKYTRDYTKIHYDLPEIMSGSGNGSGNAKCSQCGENGIEIGDKFRPPKKNSKEWNTLNITSVHFQKCTDLNPKRAHRKHQTYILDISPIGINPRTHREIKGRYKVKTKTPL